MPTCARSRKPQASPSTPTSTSPTSFRISSAAASARLGSWSGIGLRLRHVGGRLASCMRWDKHICSGAVRLSAGGSSGLSHGLPHGLAAPYSISDAVCCTWAGRCRRGCRDHRLAIGRSGIAFCHAHVPLPASYCVLALDSHHDRNLWLDRLPVGSRSLVLQA